MKAALRLPTVLLLVLGVGSAIALIVAATLAGWLPFAGLSDAIPATEVATPPATPAAPTTASRSTVPSAQSQLEWGPGVSAERILFGQSAAFSGPAQELGKNMNLGILAAFQEANRRTAASTAGSWSWCIAMMPTNLKPPSRTPRS